MDHGARSHSPYGASSAHRWFACPGSIREIAKHPPRGSSIHAEEGTYAHEILEHCLRTETHPQTLIGLHIFTATEKRVSPQGVTDEQAAAVAVAYEYVEFLLASFPDARLLLEQTIRLPSTCCDDAYGTADIIINIPSHELLYVIDYKNGVQYVEAEGNEQTAYYGVLGLEAFEWKPQKCVLVIVQPNVMGPPIREWEIEASMLAMFLHRIDARIEDAMQPDAPLVPGEKQCRWCDAAPYCPALESRAVTVAGQQFSSLKQIDAASLPDPKAMDAGRLAQVLEAGKLMTAWLKTVEEHAKNFAREGNKIPGFKLVEAQATRKIVGNDRLTGDENIAEYIAMEFDVPLDEIYPRKLLGITAVEAAVMAAATASAPNKKAATALRKEATDKLAFLCEKRSSGNLTLAPDADPRPAVDHLRLAFQGVTVIEHEG